MFSPRIPISLGAAVVLTLSAVKIVSAAEEKIRFSVAAVTASYMDEFVGMPAPSDYSKFFDYTIVRKIYRELKTAGWKPTP